MASRFFRHFHVYKNVAQNILTSSIRPTEQKRHKNEGSCKGPGKTQKSCPDPPKPYNTPHPPTDPPDDYNPKCCSYKQFRVPEAVTCAVFRPLRSPEEKLGPQASKKGKYKNPEYFAYHRFSFHEVQRQSIALRDERLQSKGVTCVYESEEECGNDESELIDDKIERVHRKQRPAGAKVKSKPSSKDQCKQKGLNRKANESALERIKKLQAEPWRVYRSPFVVDSLDDDSVCCVVKDKKDPVKNTRSSSTVKPKKPKKAKKVLKKKKESDNSLGWASPFMVYSLEKDDGQCSDSVPKWFGKAPIVWPSPFMVGGEKEKSHHNKSEQIKKLKETAIVEKKEVEVKETPSQRKLPETAEAGSHGKVLLAALPIAEDSSTMTKMAESDIDDSNLIPSPFMIDLDDKGTLSGVLKELSKRTEDEDSTAQRSPFMVDPKEVVDKSCDCDAKCDCSGNDSNTKSECK